MGKFRAKDLNIDIRKKRSKIRFIADMIKIHTDTDAGCD